MTLNSQAYFTVSGENKMVRNIPLFLIVLVVSVKTYSGRENSYDSILKVVSHTLSEMPVHGGKIHNGVNNQSFGE